MSHTIDQSRPDSQPGRQRRPGQRLAWLDALRGFAALCVVFDHGSTLLVLPARSFLYHWVNLGQYGVFLFFLVSGYIIPASLERKGSLREFWIGRLFRLYPMFIVAMLLALVAFLTGHGTIDDAARHPLTSVLAWLFMQQNQLTGPDLPNVTWTLSYEMAFYLLLAALFSWGVHRFSGWYASAFSAGALALGGILPMGLLTVWARRAGDGPLALNAVADALLAAGIALVVLSPSGPGRAGLSRAGLVRAGASLAAVTAVGLALVNQTYPYPWSGCVILALMFCGTLIYRTEQLSPGGTTPRTPRVSPGRTTPRTRVPTGRTTRQALLGPRARRIAVVVAVFAAAAAAGAWHGPGFHLDHHWQVQWVTSVLGAGATFGLAMLGRRLPVPRWCAWLGVISYSVYLLQSLVFDAYRSVPALHHKHTMVNQVLFFAGCLAVIIGLSALTYYLIERPMQRLGRRVAARLAPAGARPASGQAGPGYPTSTGSAQAPAVASRSASSSSAVAGGSGGSP